MNVVVDVHGDVLRQMEVLRLDSKRPLLVTDADEVLVHFIAGLDGFLARHNLRLDLVSFAITGNVRRANGEALSAHEVAELLTIFFETETERLDPVEGAAEALAALSERAQVLVLSNLPQAQLEARARWLARHGMDYPLVANIGLKGPALRWLAERAGEPVFFIDDIPHNLASVAETAPQVYRVHYVANPRLAAVVPPSLQSHRRTQSWPETRAFVEDQLTAHGF